MCNWEDIFEIDSTTLKKKWNYFNLEDYTTEPVVYRHYRVFGHLEGACKIGKMKLIGH